MITAHKLTEPLKWCVSYLSSFDENVIIIHYDKKSNIADLTPLKKDNVFILDENDRVDVKWGEFSLVEATIKLLIEAKKHQPDYYSLISGDDVPLMSNDKINTLLHNNDGYDFIDYVNLSSISFNPMIRIKYIYPVIFFIKSPSFFNKLQRKVFFALKDILFINKELLSSIDNIFPNGVFKGTNWFTLHFSSVDFILNWIDANNDKIYLFKKTLCSDESFFHSILKSKPNLVLFESNNESINCLRYIDWKSGPDYPKTLDESDIPKIKLDYMFARKIKDDIHVVNEFKKLI